jgi:hypothetical protein
MVIDKAAQQRAGAAILACAGSAPRRVVVVLRIKK